MRHQVAAFVSHRDVHGLTDFLGFLFCRRDHPARLFQSHDGFLSCQLIFSITSVYLRKKKPSKIRKRGKSPTPIRKIGVDSARGYAAATIPCGSNTNFFAAPLSKSL